MLLLQTAWIFVCLWTVALASDAHYPTAYLIRHGEKPADPDNHNLTFIGIMRAHCLRSVFGAHSEYDIGHIMVPTVKWSECSILKSNRRCKIQYSCGPNEREEIFKFETEWS